MRTNLFFYQKDLEICKAVAKELSEGKFVEEGGRESTELRKNEEMPRNL